MEPRTRKPLEVSTPPERFFGYYPGTVAVVTAAHAEERNVMSAGWHSALSADPPLYGVAIAPGRYTHALVKAAGSFAVHFLPFRNAEAIAGAGSVSKHDEVDKFTLLGLELGAASVVSAPILQDAYLAYECQVREVHVVGDHDWFVGEVVAIHYRPEAFDERLLKRGDAFAAAVYYGRSMFESLGQGERAEYHPDRFRTVEIAKE